MVMVAFLSLLSFSLLSALEWEEDLCLSAVRVVWWSFSDLQQNALLTTS